MKLIKYMNGTFEEEKALYDADDGYLIKTGDYYHYRIDAWMEGFVDGLLYMNEKVDISDEWIVLMPIDDMFEEVGFSDEG